MAKAICVAASGDITAIDLPSGKAEYIYDIMDLVGDERLVACENPDGSLTVEIENASPMRLGKDRWVLFKPVESTEGVQ